MAKVDLSIVDRGTSGNGEWVAENTPIAPEDLDKVMEQKTDNSGALNSLPTPFARFFVAREAFRRVYEEKLDSKNSAGFAYTQLVSDILDVYELLFNLKYHRNNTWKDGQKLELREWNSKENMDYLKAKMPVLYNSVVDYYKTDIIEDKLYFLVYTENGKEVLLACSSPITGFVTPPDMDKAILKKDNTATICFAGEQYQNLHIRRKSGGEYFRGDVRLFDKRDAEFKNYMYSMLFGTDTVDQRFKAIKEYVRSFNNDPEIRNDFRLKTAPVLTDQNDGLVINGLHIQSSDEIDINSYFTDTMIRVPYRISRGTFKSVVYQNDVQGRNYDYLLPFKPEVMNLFDGKELDSDVHINRNSVTVKLRYNGIEYSKEYSQDSFRAGHGRIVDLQGAKINFDLGIFPNILSYKDVENNYFKVLVVAADEDVDAPNFNIDQINLVFFKQAENGFKQIKEVVPQNMAEYGVEPAVVRSRQRTDVEESGTKFYELFNTAFDMIEVNVMGNTGLLMPVWQHSQASNETFTYAIDLGTSNTFMSRCKNDSQGNPDLSKKPELFRMDKTMVNYMHEYSDDTQYSITRRIEDSIFDKARNKIKTEFVPVVIDGKDYKFPIRTALCGIRTTTNKPKLFDNHNIAFFYEKYMANDDQNVNTDIKWEQNEDKLRVFVRELLLIIKCDILQRNGDLDRTNLVWFSPLSFMGNTREVYQNIWNSEPKNILFIQPQQIVRYSESEAPYYYYKKMNYIKDSDAVTVIDIGGGSTDFVYFKDNEPQVANSVHFGCDVLWENGFIEFANVRENGIFKKYVDTIRFQRKDLEDLNECFKNVDSVKTKDIINFWLSNAKDCDIIKFMSQDFKPVFVYHLTCILFYMANMYKEKGLDAPRTVVFSGNGSKYIDNFISSESVVLKKIIDLIFTTVYGGNHDVNIKLPEERKESTCYGGLYRDKNAPIVKDVVYQGDVARSYEKVGDMNNNLDSLKAALLIKYKNLAALYKSVIELLKQEKIIDGRSDTRRYVSKAEEDMGTPFTTYYKTQVKEKYGEEVIYNDSVFFLPVINKVFEMTNLRSMLIISFVAFGLCLCFQLKYFFETIRQRELYYHFFKKKQPYDVSLIEINKEVYTQLVQVGEENSDLNLLIEEINHYILKTKGTTDFAVIQNKVERKLNMRYDQSVAKLSFPTHFGLMGTFLGVFIGVLMFIIGFDSTNGITDNSIKNLLEGVLVSMLTSLCGLGLTTWNNARAGEARKKIEEDKNEFYDFIQTELMPSLDVSLVAAITKLHYTVDRFEPAFDRVINRFQDTFDNCTKAFGSTFEQNVKAVASAVDVMGKNMDKINENIDLQEKLLATLKSGELVQGLDRYIEASNNFVSITQSLNKFEEARRMMLAATQEAINIQNTYSDSLKIPREVAVRINQILDRISKFEENINALGPQLAQRSILGDDIVNALKEQISGISKKGKIADSYLEMADGRLEELFAQQTKVIGEMNKRYREALEGHLDGFEEMIKFQTNELEKRHKDFMKAIEERLAIEDVRREFVNPGRLKDIDGKIADVSKRVLTTDDIKKAVQDAVQPISKELDEIKQDFRKQVEESQLGGLRGLFGRR